MSAGLNFRKFGQDFRQGTLPHLVLHLVDDRYLLYKMVSISDRSENNKIGANSGAQGGANWDLSPKAKPCPGRPYEKMFLGV